MPRRHLHVVVSCSVDRALKMEIDAHCNRRAFIRLNSLVCALGCAREFKQNSERPPGDFRSRSRSVNLSCRSSTFRPGRNFPIRHSRGVYHCSRRDRYQKLGGIIRDDCQKIRRAAVADARNMVEGRERDAMLIRDDVDPYRARIAPNGRRKK